MSTAQEAPATGAAARRAVEIVDCDVHPSPRSNDELLEYFPEPWRSYEARGPERPIDTFTLVSQTPNGGVRLDSVPPGGGKPGTDPAFAVEQMRRMGDLRHAILIPLASARPRENADREAASCHATNLWLADTWIGRDNIDDVFRGSLRVALNDPALAVREIEFWAGDDRFVQICMAPGTLVPLGDPLFDPVHAAAARAGVPMGMHPLTAPGSRLLTPVGFPTYFDEYHSEAALIAMAHLTSLVFNGTFDKFPGLRYAMIESGNAWLAPLLWKMDRHWHEFRAEYPAVRRAPSEIVAERVRVATQPLESPPRDKDLAWLLEAVDVGDMFMYSSDYPHHDADEPDWVLKHVPDERQARIMSGTARDFYGLGPAREAPAR